MKKIVLDSGPVISLALNNLLWLLEKVKKTYDIHFYITEPIRKELVDNPLTTKRFKLEAFQVLRLLQNKVIEVVSEDKIIQETESLIDLANRTYKAKHKYLRLVHFAEVSALVAAMHLSADAIMIDERTTRYLLERPDKLRNLLMHKLHTKVVMVKENLAALRRETKSIKLIRSAEFVTVAYEQGLLDDFLPKIGKKSHLLDALLWALKINGCAISNKDLETIKRIESKKWLLKDS